MQDARSTNDAQRTPELHELVFSLIKAIAVSVTLDVAQIANMADLAVRTSVSVSERVVMGTSSNTSVCEITELVDVKAMKVV